MACPWCSATGEDPRDHVSICPRRLRASLAETNDMADAVYGTRGPEYRARKCGSVWMFTIGGHRGYGETLQAAFDDLQTWKGEPT